jgi:chemotaxis protein methyltransferase CheR
MTTTVAADPKHASDLVAAAEQGEAFSEAIRPLNDKEFALFTALIEREAGIHLSEVKKALLVGRLSKRLRELGLRSFMAYYRRVTEDDPAEKTQMIDRICTNETHFFREPRQFEFLVDTVFPEWQARAMAGRRSRRIRVWSAACSTGEEPYTLAMVLLDHFSPQLGWQIEILASDLSTRVLDRASAATYPIERTAEIPEHYLHKYMLKGMRSQEGLMRAGPAIRSLIRFAQVNLVEPSYPVVGTFDLIFCRNILIYFEMATKRRVIDQLLSALEPDGLLFLGHAESLSGLNDRVRSVGPTVYALTERAAVQPRIAAPARPLPAPLTPRATPATLAARRSLARLATAAARPGLGQSRHRRARTLR